MTEGFTLIETLVAISIFTISILGLLIVLGQGISNTNYAKQKIIASYLAQEGIEYMRNMRDTFVLYDASGVQAGWNAFNAKIAPAPNTLCASGDGCYFDDYNLNYTNHLQPMAEISLIACSPSCSSLLYDENTGKYGYTTGINSGFIRKINATQIANQTKISSTVYWTQGSGNYNIVFSESLFNWIE
jgi:Tfp pilus assembly protein PilV